MAVSPEWYEALSVSDVSVSSVCSTGLTLGSMCTVPHPGCENTPYPREEANSRTYYINKGDFSRSRDH
jgi:hypothetical protein